MEDTLFFKNSTINNNLNLQVHQSTHWKKIQNKKNNLSFIPKEDGFITTSGNPQLGEKFGNIHEIMNVTNKPPTQ